MLLHYAIYFFLILASYVVKAYNNYVLFVHEIIGRETSFILLLVVINAYYFYNLSMTHYTQLLFLWNNYSQRYPMLFEYKRDIAPSAGALGSTTLYSLSFVEICVPASSFGILSIIFPRSPNV